MVYPTFKSATRNDAESMASRMNQLRLKGIQTDITFSIKGKTFSAHKAVLATKSEYCMSQFNGSWNTSDIVQLEDMGPRILEILLNYIYHDRFDWTRLQANEVDSTRDIAFKLDRLLDILVGADRWLMQDMKTEVEQQILQGNRLLIRADNVRHIKHIADEYNAKALKEYCQEFEDRNAEAVRLANLSSSEEEDEGEEEEGEVEEEEDENSPGEEAKDTRV